jgi:hypothetical protein
VKQRLPISKIPARLVFGDVRDGTHTAVMDAAIIIRMPFQVGHATRNTRNRDGKLE